nr:unnamed protein product [Callosobruchus analis]
MRAAQPSTSKN